MKNRLFHAILTTLLVCLLLTPVSCGNKDTDTDTDENPTPPNTPTVEAGVTKGFGISPKGFPLDYSKIADFYSEVGGMTNGGVMWNGLWRENGAGTLPQAAASLQQASTIYGFTPIVVFGWRSGTTLYLDVPSNTTNNWTNTETRSLFQSMLVSYATTYKPPYLFVGNENSAYLEQNPSDYFNWITFYNSAYDAIKAASPNTMVGTVFNFEHLAGSGALNDWTTAQWGALESHDLSKVDILGITLYPWLNYASPSSVPSNYLDPLISRIGSKPIAITETGWPAENLGGLNPPWETSQQAQVTYLTQLNALLEGKDVRVVNWLFLNQMADTGGGSLDWKLFGSVSLRDSAGNKRSAYDSWLAFSP